MTIQQLYYVIIISETGSFNKASEILYISQPSLTSSVKELEKELGIVIFNRGGRGVTLTNDGAEFILYARQLYQQYGEILEKYGKGGKLKKKFGISAQHYSFAVKSFVEMVKKFNTEEYEFAIRETKTKEVIEDVSSGKSEIGIIYLSDFNRAALTKLLQTKDLKFHKLTSCDAFVYLWKGHPLAKNRSIRFEELNEYMICKKTNKSLVVGFWNLFADDIPLAEIELDREYSSIKFVLGQGDLSGEKVILKNVAPYSFVCFILEI